MIAQTAITPAPAATPALVLRHIRHAYDRVVAVDEVSLTIAQGEIVCLVGPSGCGKSTLLRVAAGLEELQRGEVRIGNRIVADGRRTTPPEGRGVGLVFQDYALFPHLTVLDNVRFGLAGQRSDVQRRRALEALSQVGMSDHAGAFPHMLSGGQQQRVALARAMAPNPGVLLLDEPFSGLDVRLRAQVRDETLHVLKQNGAATMIVTHDPEEAMFLADRIALMNHGRIAQLGTPLDLYCRPTSAFAAAFFGEVNDLAGIVDHGLVRTPLGDIAAPDLEDGAPVRVLIRPEAMQLAVMPGPGELQGRVEASRLLGRTSMIHLSVADGAAPPLHVHVRTGGQFLPREGSLLSIRLDPAQAFVFPAGMPI
ncbi:MAG: ABC transporter ATP-binding protein [Inquilinaceae bacterium]